MARSSYTYEKFQREKKKAEKKAAREAEKAARRAKKTEGPPGAPVIHPVDALDRDEAGDTPAAEAPKAEDQADDQTPAAEPDKRPDDA